jgi:CBS-domain-containing membrane protein
VRQYFSKMRGVSQPPPLPRKKEVVLAFVGSCLALSFIALMHESFSNALGLPLIMAPFGASAVLVFGAFRSPLAQPRNVLGGHVISALIGVSVYYLVGDAQVLAISLAVPTAIAVMYLSGTLHPPGGATAFVTAAGGSSIHALGYWYVLSPCALGSIILILFGLVINNIPAKQQYPQFW